MGPPRRAGWDWETQATVTDAKSLAWGARKTRRSSPNLAVTLGERLHLYGSLFPHL